MNHCHCVLLKMQVMPATNYLEEYRRKYQPISTPDISPSDSQCATDIQTLLQRYLGTSNGQSAQQKSLASTSDKLTEGHDKPATHTESVEEVIKPDDLPSASGGRSDSDDDIFDDDDIEKTLLLPISGLNNRLRLTVDDIMKRDSQLGELRNAKAIRRHSNPNEGGCLTKHKRRIPRRFSSTSDEFEAYSKDGGISYRGVAHSESDVSLGGLRRRDSNLSNNSLESNASNKSNMSFKGDILELSDEEFDFDIEIDLNSSKQSDSDSQKLFSQFKIDSDSQKDAESITGFDEVDGISCANCHPTSARSHSSSDSTPILCPNCTSNRTERNATIKEILDSELSFYKDLLLIKEHFHDPLLHNGLLNSDEISTVFGNILRLIGVSKKFSNQLKNHLQGLNNSGDDDYGEAAIGRLICETSAMFLAFETYCLNYSTSISTIDQLRRDNVLLNLFLDASLKDNAALRRMDFKTFLMLPVQRVMKYPLLLKRLHKVTHYSHPDRDDLEKAHEKLTNILHHINAQSKVLSSMFSNTKENKSKKRTSFEIALIKLVLDTLNWKHDEIHFLSSGKIGFLQPGESQWAEKLKTSRYNTAYAVVVSKGRDHLSPPLSKCRLLFPRKTRVSNAALLVIKKGSSRLQVLGEPYYLSNCLISRNTEFYDVFEIQEYLKESLVIRPIHSSETWYRHLKYYSMVLGGRKHRRRNALSNILLQT